MTAALLLIAALACYGWFMGLGPLRHRWPACLGRFPRLLVRTFVAFGASSGVFLLLLGRPEAAWRMPVEFVSAARLARASTGISDADLRLPWLVAAILTGGLIGGLVSRWRGGRMLVFGKIDAVLPRTRYELGWGVLLSLNAGVSEELFFRLLIPLLIALVTGSAVLGFAVAAVLFALAHRYQGWLGMLATAVVGVVLTAAYLVTGALWTAVLLHIAIDLNGLVLRPLMGGGLHPEGAS